MQLVHEPASGNRTTVASTVDTADSFLAKARGLMFRRSIPDDYAIAFRFDDARVRDVHMVFVFVALDVVWVVDDVVTRVETLKPWRGFGRDEADLIVELPAGAATDVEPGDGVRLQE
ncbi:DUF192 domain-containing protein [Halovivax cerinus]|uniref:DUF192 domain-containing protein n=1 Tax=Halovivax cerinus TaxID=1487865 RepID=A0ABD5NNU6_9EURY|nr:DUF192 domain-containing protein [Halovivax cerinus]